MEKPFTVALIGNPNSGKTTVFNALTGSRQTIGNWPGVTVERKEGVCRLPDGKTLTVVDLPGVYSLMASSEDERIAVDYALSREADLFINVVDAANIERNLYLTLLLTELRVPVIHLLTMMDVVQENQTIIDVKHLAQHLGAPVITADTRGRVGTRKLLAELQQVVDHPALPVIRIDYPPAVESEIAHLLAKCQAVADKLHVPARWVAIQLLEADPDVTARFREQVSEDELAEADRRIQAATGAYTDEVFANARYGVIQGLCAEVVHRHAEGNSRASSIDRWILNRWLGIPFFFAVMFVIFWVTQIVGGAFIDFFEDLGGTLFVETPRFLLEKINAPAPLIALLADGLGTGLQTMAAFLPPIFFMFLCLAILEDSGYMARAAFVMDRAMSWLGLPGKSFVPLLVGFGCSVPAILATRTLENRRDRFLTIFMTPFMSCGAKLPIYVVFGAAFFANNPGRLIFYMYITGIVLGILTGLLLKKTLFTGEPSHFIMELPPYHVPRFKYIMLNAWDRLRYFIFRAGQVIVPMVLVLGLLNSIGRDGLIGNHDSRESLLATAGSTLTPIFTPMGVEEENWPATVAIFSGLFAKEAVIGTLNSLYGQNQGLESEVDEEEGFNFLERVGDAFRTIPPGLADIVTSLTDPLHLRDARGDESEISERFEADETIFASMRRSFTKGRHQAFAYLLFILLYMPCFAAVGAAYRELGRFYTAVLMIYLTVLGWCVATLYYQVMVGHQLLWLGVPLALLAAMSASFYYMGRSRRVPLV